MSNTNRFFILFLKLYIKIINQLLVSSRLSNTSYSSVCILIWSAFKLKFYSLKLIKIKYFNSLVMFIEICNYLYLKLTDNFVVLLKYV